MRFPILRTLMLLIGLCTCTSTIADEPLQNGQCSDIDSRHDCAYLGELSDSVLVVGFLDSCTESAPSVRLGSNEDPESSVIYQFDIAHTSVVKLDVDGLGDTSVLKNDTLVLLSNENVTSIKRRFEPGRYTLIGRAPLCGNGIAEKNVGYKIQLDPQGGEESIADASETVDSTDGVVELAREKPDAQWNRVSMLILIALMVPLTMTILWLFVLGSI